MNTKAHQVQSVYDEAWDNDSSSEGCYSVAVHAARELGGVELENSNDDGSKSFAPSILFVFADSSAVYVTYGGTCVIGPNEAP